MDLPMKKSEEILTEANIFWTVLAILWSLVHIWDAYVSFRQHKMYKTEEKPPKVLEKTMDQDSFDKTRSYNLDKSTFGFWLRLWSQLVTTVVLLGDWIPIIWNWGDPILNLLNENWVSSEFYKTIVFLLVTSLVSTVIDLPWSLYSTFVIEEKHGFNKQTIHFYLWDQAKKLAIDQMIMIPIIAAIVQIVKVGGGYFFIYFWLFYMVVKIVLMTVCPDYIALLFEKYTPLEEGELRTRIEALASSIAFPLKKIYIVEGSKRSEHSNAYFYGFFNNKRIVLFDTLLEAKAKPVTEEDKEEKTEEKPNLHKKKGCNNDEILAVLGHELGHWKLNHVLINIIISQSELFFSFSVFALLYRNPVLFAAFGFHSEMPVVIGFYIISQYIFTPCSYLQTLAMTRLSRKLEFQADHFAKMLKLTANLKTALIKLDADNLSFPIYDWLYSACYNSPPPLLERLKALDKAD